MSGSDDTEDDGDGSADGVDAPAGRFAAHPLRLAQPFLVAPTTGAAFNTLSLDLVAVACVQLPDILFEFDSSFPVPSVAAMLQAVGPLRRANVNAAGQLPPLSVFGHADPTGDDGYNKLLSGRRAMAIYGVLTRDTALWDFLFDHAHGGDDWKAKKVLATMAAALGRPAGTSRAVLVPAYMEMLAPEALAKGEFLGQGADPKGKADFQGCSEFNPLELLSVDENRTLSKAQRNAENASNRRVIIFLFRGGTKVDPGRWPCPRALEGIDGCRKRFFAPPNSGDQRRQPGGERRRFAVAQDTFACRFYDRIARLSPCELPAPPRPLVNPIIAFAGDAADRGIVAAGAVSGRNFVIVKKPYTKPARVRVTLRSDTPFDGSGEFTLSDRDPIRFFRDADSLLALRFDGTDNVFNGAELTVGVVLFAEGLKASKTVDDVTLTLTLSARFATIASVARATMTAVDVVLDIAAARVSATADPVPLAQPTTGTAPAGKPTDKLFGGRFLRLQDTGRTQERALLIVHLRPESFATTLELTLNSNRVSLFQNESPAAGDAPLVLPLDIPSPSVTARGRRFFVQGDTLSTALRDVQFGLGVKGVDPDCDRVTVTVTVRIDIVLDANDDHLVDQSEPVAKFVRVALWDRAFDGTTGVLQNTSTEVTNFAGADRRRFYFRVEDAQASGEVRARWKTIAGNGAAQDAGGTLEITCTETSAGSKVFVSHGVILVADDIDKAQATDSGLAAGKADAGSRTAGSSNHRLRKVVVDDTHKLDSQVMLEYTPASGIAPTPVKVPVFDRGPEERKKIKVHLVNVRDRAGGTAILTAARKTSGVAQMRSIYATCGIFLEVDEIVIDPPASCTGWATRFPAAGAAGIAVDPAVETSGFVSGNLVPSATQSDIINLIRARADFDANDLYIVYVDRIYATPLPTPPAATGPQLQIGPGGTSFPDSFTAAGSIARSFTFVGVNTVNVLADVHEMTHVTTNLRNSAGGHFHLQATVAAGPGLVDGKNLMQRFALISTGAVTDSKRLWDESFSNAGITPAAIPAQVSAIRASRFIKPL